MQPRFFLLAVATLLTAGTAFADELVFQSPSSQSNAWQGYWTSPYLVMDQSVPPSGELLTVYCLDFNHEVAPPFSWDATIRPLDLGDVSLFQYGQSADAWQHYAAAASLFQKIEDLLVTKPTDANLLETEYQAAAWKLFVDGDHEASLDSKIDIRHVPHGWLPLQSGKVLRLGSLPFTEDEECFSRSAARDSPFERLSSGIVTLAGHHASLDTRPKARRSVNWSSSGTAPNLPWR